MSCDRCYNSHSNDAITFYASSVRTQRSSILNPSLMSFLESLLLFASKCRTFALVCFNKSSQTLVSSPTFETFVGETPYGDLFVNIPYVRANSPDLLIEFNLL